MTPEQYQIQKETFRTLFAYIGIDRLKVIITEAEATKSDKYLCLAELYTHAVRQDLAKQNDDIIHTVFELEPKLSAFKEAFNKQIQ